MTAAQKLLCRIAGVTSVALLSVPAFAADADFDVTSLIAMLQLVLAAVPSSVPPC